jgi:hypothetical protein
MEQLRNGSLGGDYSYDMIKPHRANLCLLPCKNEVIERLITADALDRNAADQWLPDQLAF